MDMPRTLGFVLRDEQGPPDWEKLEDPPCVVSFGDDDFVRVRCEDERIYVNGYPAVAGISVLETGDIVRIYPAGGEAISYRYAGRLAETVEPGEGRRCAFTGEIITGQAVRCRCGAILSQEVAEQLNQCGICTAPLGAGDNAQARPPEELK
ncbi:MAG: hypothetical protein C0404_05975 [Verrucomicrobia bacterium]|nr:hypothetical protein [Verrucomicrobiota bacterium]